MVSIEALEQMTEPQSLRVSELDALLLPMDAGLAHLAAVSIDSTGLGRFRAGQSADCLQLQAGAGDESAMCRVYDEQGQLQGLGELAESGNQVAPRRVLQLD